VPVLLGMGWACRSSNTFGTAHSTLLYSQECVISYDESYIEIVVALALNRIHPLDAEAMDLVLTIRVCMPYLEATFFHGAHVTQ
jgi:hypothetical protein